MKSKYLIIDDYYSKTLNTTNKIQSNIAEQNKTQPTKS